MRRGDGIPAGARVLKILKEFLASEHDYPSTARAFAAMRERTGRYDPQFFDCIAKELGTRAELAPPRSTEIFEITAKQLFLGQTLLSNVHTKDGVLLISAGSLVTETLLEKLKNYAALVGVQEPIRVNCLIPTNDTKGSA